MESKQIRLDPKYKSLEKGFFDIENDGVLYLSWPKKSCFSAPNRLVFIVMQMKVLNVSQWLSL